jgi:hypothetical protein
MKIKLKDGKHEFFNEKGEEIKDCILSYSIRANTGSDTVATVTFLVTELDMEVRQQKIYKDLKGNEYQQVSGEQK